VRNGFPALCLVAVCAAFAPAAGAATFSNPTAITDPTQGMAGGANLPYPSTISVNGESGTITKAAVTLVNVQGGPAKDLDVLLAGPGGSSILMSDICSVMGINPDFTGQTFSFDDDAQAAIPGTCSGSPASGAYKPTNYDTTDSFPGIPGPYPIGMANVRGTPPNGDWKLYAVDDAYPDPVTINGGWRLELTTTGAGPPSAQAPATKRKKCKKHKKRSVSTSKKRCKKKRR
jgi:subtilisin-like proprotein convertase family protein